MIPKKLEVNVRCKDILRNGKYLRILGHNNFQVEEGEFVSILGESGCGKTTLLNIIAGLEDSYDGEIFLDGVLSKKPSVDKGVVFQTPRLLPWISVRKNIEFAIPAKKKLKLNRHSLDLISLVGLSGYENALPLHLSGGMAQRVAFARALVNLPTLLLLDEPLAALDSRTRMFMQQELQQILAQEKVTTVMVTHDIDEAVFLSDRILIMRKDPGSIQHIISVDLEKPRQRLSENFFSMKSKVFNVFESIDNDN